MTSKRFSVVGNPISHSLSPAIHMAAYKQLGLNWTYEKHEVHSGSLESFIESHAGEFAGLSVTMPLKLEAADLATSKDPIVSLLGVANTLLLSEGNISAFNTDVFGITQALTNCWKQVIETVAIVGAGATARSALLAIHDKAPKSEVSVYVRRTSDTKALSHLADALDVTLRFEDLGDFGTQHDLTINTAPAAALPKDSAVQQGWLLDVNYAKADSEALAIFDSAKVVSGKDMLLWQAIAQIRLFTSLDATLELPNEDEVLQAMVASLQ